jgi:hypothetical protein
MRSRRLALAAGFPPYLVLLRVGFTLPPPLLPERYALTAPFHPYRTVNSGFEIEAWVPALQANALPAGGSRRSTSPAVCFLWHWPSTGFEARVPDVIRHTALRSSDFPLPENSCLRKNFRQRPPGPPASL